MFDARRIPTTNNRPATQLPAGVVFVVALCWLLYAQGGASHSAEPAAELSHRVGALVEQLSDDQFSVRDEARRNLAALIDDPAARMQVGRMLLGRTNDPQLSFDVRATLRSLVPKDVEAERQVEPKSADVAQWFDDLDAASFETRSRAADQLATAAASSSACGPILERLLQTNDGGAIPSQTRRRQKQLWSTAWRTWLTSNSAWRPKFSPERLQALIERIAQPAAEDKPEKAVPPAFDPNLADVVNDDAPVAQATTEPESPAERELLLLLACDEHTAATADALRRRLADPQLDVQAAARLSALYAWAHPAMAAEYWQDGRHHSVQHLLLGVPNHSPGAERPSLFDKCDDKTAHCVSGNSLSPGDHPVGVFFPHPKEIQQNAQFHLVNLPTPRRRMAYEFEAPTASSSAELLRLVDVRRRREITRRTVQYLLAEKRLLTPREIDMFQYLDPEEASRFAEPYLLGVDDERYDSGSPQAFGNGSLHGWFCYNMTLLGTPEVGRALAKAIDKQRVLEPTAAKPYRIDWVAALSLGYTVPWSGIDAWLAAQIDRTEPIRIDQPKAADVGASAAALLVRRHGGDLSTFGLERHTFVELTDLENPGYRFTNADGRADVKKWWSEQPAATNGAKAP
jgi:hypothetical protein